ncbi:hypothetical protein AAY473_000314 [Plecturocebus cupreus]
MIQAPDIIMDPGSFNPLLSRSVTPLMTARGLPWLQVITPHTASKGRKGWPPSHRVLTRPFLCAQAEEGGSQSQEIEIILANMVKPAHGGVSHFQQMQVTWWSSACSSYVCTLLCKTSLLLPLLTQPLLPRPANTNLNKDRHRVCILDPSLSEFGKTLELGRVLPRMELRSGASWWRRRMTTSPSSKSLFLRFRAHQQPEHFCVSQFKFLEQALTDLVPRIDAPPPPHLSQLLGRLRHHNCLNPSGGGSSEPRSHHCTPARQQRTHRNMRSSGASGVYEENSDGESHNNHKTPFEKLRQADHLTSGVQDQPGKHALWEAEAGGSRGQEINTFLANIFTQLETGGLPCWSGWSQTPGLKQYTHLSLPKPRQADHLSSEVQDQPGQHGETQFLLKIQKSAGMVVHTCNSSYSGG